MGQPLSISVTHGKVGRPIYLYEQLTTRTHAFELYPLPGMISPISHEIIRLKFSSSSFQKTSMRLPDLSCLSLLHLGAPSTLYEHHSISVRSIDMLQSCYPYHRKGYTFTKTKKEKDLVLQYLSGHYTQSFFNNNIAIKV